MTSTITPTLINEARLTLSIDDVYIPVNTALTGFNRQVFGINYPYLMPNGKDYPNKIPTVTVRRLLRLGRRSVSVAFFRHDLDLWRYAHESLGQPHD